MENKLIIGTELDTKSFEKQIEHVEEQLASIDAMLSKKNKLKLSSEQVEKAELEAEKLNNQLQGLYEKQAKINSQGFSNMQQSLNNVSNSMGSIAKKVVRWGLAVFGVRSMYLGIRQAVSQIMQEDENLKYQIDYMKFAVGQAIKPVVEWIVNLVHQLLVWLGAIIKILFGINIFANATAGNFKKANGSAKQLKKTLSGFDEMNVLNEDGSTGKIGAINNALKDFGDIAKQVDELADKLKPFENEIKAIAILAGTIFGAKMIGGMISGIGKLIGGGGLGKLGSKLGSLATIASGIVITGLIAKQVWDEAQQLKEEIDKINEAGKKGQKEWLKNEDDINKIINTQNVNRTAANKLLEQSNGWMEKIFGWDKKNLETARQTSENINGQIAREIELYNAEVKKNGVTEKSNKMQQDIKNQIAEQYQWNLKLEKALFEAGMDTSKIRDLNKQLVKNYKDMGGEVTEVKNELGVINRIKFDTKEIKVTADTKPAETQIGKLGYKLAQVGINLGDSIRRQFGAKGMLYTPPKLAVGGIINQPGRGVPIGSAYGGERGMEGVIPLTDSQQMALLGEAIGKYINVNLTNITELDGRQIARKVEQINQNNNFVLNR